jgi:hypothetical protein
MKQLAKSDFSWCFPTRVASSRPLAMLMPLESSSKPQERHTIIGDVKSPKNFREWWARHQRNRSTETISCEHKATSKCLPDWPGNACDPFQSRTKTTLPSILRPTWRGCCWPHQCGAASVRPSVLALARARCQRRHWHSATKVLTAPRQSRRARCRCNPSARTRPATTTSGAPKYLTMTL